MLHVTLAKSLHLRYRVDGIGKSEDGTWVVYEFKKCGANHLCPHEDCVYRQRPDLLEKARLVDRSLREQVCELNLTLCKSLTVHCLGGGGRVPG